MMILPRSLWLSFPSLNKSVGNALVSYHEPDH